jgi:predicted TIM-barrel fold metal-dependent hydrolase
MIDCHIHAVPPNLPGTGALCPLLTKSPDEVAAQIRLEMQTTRVTDVFAMGAWDAGDDDPLGINTTLVIAKQVPGMRAVGVADPTRTDPAHFRKVEALLAANSVVALKCYLGYLHFEPSHANYRHYYDLAAKYRVPVMFHTGDTYSPRAKLKYAHPLGIDDVAVDHPECKFVMCHVGNPWTTDAAEVIYKNMNVWTDLSGLLVGTDEVFASDDGRDAAAELAHAIQRAIRYSERPNRFLYGTDWPLAPMGAYRDFIFEAIPPEWHDQVFVENSRMLFRV